MNPYRTDRDRRLDDARCRYRTRVAARTLQVCELPLVSGNGNREWFLRLMSDKVAREARHGN